MSGYGYDGHYPHNSHRAFHAHRNNLTYVPNYGFFDSYSGTSASSSRQDAYMDQAYTYGGEDHAYQDVDHAYQGRDHTHREPEYMHMDGDYVHRDRGRLRGYEEYDYKDRHDPEGRRASRSRHRPSPSPTRKARRETVPYREHDHRSVTPPPMQRPSDEYIAIATQTPTTLPDSAPPSRKLLIMDLNGTLLHRGDKVWQPKRRDLSHKEERPKDSAGRPLPRLRPVHPRPYMPSFRNYLFHPKNVPWLDSMVWSSAQPYSVNDMVDKTFADTKDRLIAVWARDTLGLTDDHYARKVQTFKDLTKPWTELPAISSSSPAERSPSIASSRATPEPPSDLPSSQPSPPPPSSPLLTPLLIEQSNQVHSALTTLLLDDSPRKAERQPYNHLCIPEYTGARRAKDLELLDIQKERESLLREIEDEAPAADKLVAEVVLAEEHVQITEEKEIQTTEDQIAEPTAQSVETASAQSDTAVEEVTSGGEVEADKVSKKRKRKDKKNKRRAALLADARDPESLEDGYDPTLLAVVGILDEVKRQANVAAWIHSGGLWGPPELKLREQVHERAPPEGVAQEGEVEYVDQGVARELSPAADAEESCGSDLSVEADDAGRKEKKRRKKKRGQAESAVEGHKDVDESASTEITIHAGEGTGANQESTDETTAAAAAEASSPPSMWFEHMPTLLYWAKRGKEVLEQMAIPIEHGIER